MRRELGQHFADQPSGCAHALEFGRRAADDHGRIPFATPLSRRVDRRHQVGADAVGRLRSVDRPERRPRLVELDQRLRLPHVDLQPLADHVVVVVARAAPACPRTLARRTGTRRRAGPGVCAAAVATIRIDRRRSSSASGTAISTMISGSRPVIISSSAVRLRHRARKPVEHESRRARPAASSRSRTIPIITSSLTSSPRAIDRLGAHADRGPRLHRLAQDVAGRDLRDPARPREPLRLRALARRPAGRA